MHACTRELIQQACAAPAPTCSAAITSQCKPGCCGPNCTGSAAPTPYPVCRSCTDCAIYGPASEATAAANCSITDVFDQCGITQGGGGPGIPPRDPDFFQCQGTMANIQCVSQSVVLRREPKRRLVWSVQRTAACVVEGLRPAEHADSKDVTGGYKNVH